MARATLRQFLQEWTLLDGLDEIERNPAAYPNWGQPLKASMREETTLFLEDLAWDESRSSMQVLTASHSFVDARVASIYGVPSPSSGFDKTTFAPTHKRFGLITRPSVLTLTGRDKGSPAIWRGKFIREQILCETLSAPPNNVAELPEPKPNEPDRERLKRHREDPACSGCHELMDPLGFGLDHYGPIGELLMQDSNNQPIADDGEIVGFDDPGFKGAGELSEKLAAAPEAAACVARQLTSHLIGRMERASDECLTQTMAEQFVKSNHHLPDFIVWYVGTDIFRFRQP